MSNKVKYFDNPYEYLQWEYNRQKNKKVDLKDLDLENLFNSIKDKYDSAEFYEKDKALFKKLKRIALNVKTPFNEQDRAGYFILNRHSEKIIKVANENNVVIPDGIILGTLPLNYLEAFTCVFPQGERLIALSEGLFIYLYSMGRIISSFFSKICNNENKSYATFDFNNDSINENIKTNTKVHKLFLETLILYFLYENLSFSKIYYEEDININLSAVLWDTAELFIVAHEYSHIILGHLKTEQSFYKGLLDDNSMFYQIVRNWNQEFSADVLAFQFTMAINQKSGYGIFACYLGIEFLFSCLEIIEKIKNIESSETHPSAQMRIENLRRYFKSTLPNKSQSIIDRSNVIQEIMKSLWNSNKDDFTHVTKHFSENFK